MLNLYLYHKSLNANRLQLNYKNKICILKAKSKLDV